jgi:hypothetical protein
MQPDLHAPIAGAPGSQGPPRLYSVKKPISNSAARDIARAFRRKVAREGVRCRRSDC